MQKNSLHYYLLPEQPVNFQVLSNTKEITHPEDIVEDFTSEAVMNALKYRYELKYLGQDCKELLILCVPAFQHKIITSREKKQNNHNVVCVIKTNKETDLKGYLSGRRSAILMQGGKLIRYKGCGNDLQGFVYENKGLRGSHFIHTAKRQLFMTSLINKILMEEVNEPSANKPLLFYQFDNVQSYGLKNDLKLLPKYCCVFETVGDRRVGTHLISPLEILFLSIVQVEPTKYDNFFKDKQRLDEYGLVELLTDFQLFLDNGQNFLQKYDKSKEFTNYVAFDDFNEYSGTKMKQSDKFNSLIDDIKTKFIHNQEHKVLLSGDNDWISVIDIVLQKIGYEMGELKRIFCQRQINWGFFNDHGYFHCNAHLNNFVVKVPREKQRFILPLDFDLAFRKQQYINIDTKSKLYGQKDGQSFEQFLLSQYNAMEMSVSGVEIMNFKYSIRQDQFNPSQAVKQARIIFRDTLIKSFRWGMRKNITQYHRINQLWNENIELINSLVEFCLLISANFQT